MNLNEMTPEDLGKFWAKHRTGRKSSQEALGVDELDVRRLAAYAIARSCVLRLEAEGDAKGANIYGRHCNIYRDMMSPKAREMVK